MDGAPPRAPRCGSGCGRRPGAKRHAGRGRRASRPGAAPGRRTRRRARRRCRRAARRRSRGGSGARPEPMGTRTLNTVARLSTTTRVLQTPGRAPRVGMLVGLVLAGGITGLLLPVRAHVSRATPALLLVLAVVAAGVVGGAVAALFTALVSAAAYNVVFIPPHWTFKVDAADD